MNRKRAGTAFVLLMVVVFLFGMTVIAAKAFVEPGGWSDPAIFVQDADDTPGKNGGVDPWYDDSKGSQPQTELLYAYIDWNDVYIYARWDVEAAFDPMRQVNEIVQVYYILKIDAMDPISPGEPTHSLQFEADNNGLVKVTVRDSTGAALWTGTSGDYSRTSITVNPGDPFTVRTACEARFPWSALGSSGPKDILVFAAESHVSDASEGWRSEVMDYISVGGNPVPWFSGFMITMLVAVVAVAFLVKKKGALSTSKTLSG